MSIQTIEINGERFVILSERDFLALQASSLDEAAADSPNSGNGAHRFRDVEPIRLAGRPASELLLQDRR